jgi:hypothetical protein
MVKPWCAVRMSAQARSQGFETTRAIRIRKLQNDEPLNLPPIAIANSCALSHRKGRRDPTTGGFECPCSREEQGMARPEVSDTPKQPTAFRSRAALSGWRPRGSSRHDSHDTPDR